MVNNIIIMMQGILDGLLFAVDGWWGDEGGDCPLLNPDEPFSYESGSALTFGRTALVLCIEVGVHLE